MGGGQGRCFREGGCLVPVGLRLIPPPQREPRFPSPPLPRHPASSRPPCSCSPTWTTWPRWPPTSATRPRLPSTTAAGRQATGCEGSWEAAALIPALRPRAHSGGRAGARGHPSVDLGQRPLTFPSHFIYGFAHGQVDQVTGSNLQQLRDHLWLHVPGGVAKELPPPPPLPPRPPPLPPAAGASLPAQPAALAGPTAAAAGPRPGSAGDLVPDSLRRDPLGPGLAPGPGPGPGT